MKRAKFGKVIVSETIWKRELASGTAMGWGGGGGGGRSGQYSPECSFRWVENCQQTVVYCQWLARNYVTMFLTELNCQVF